MLIIKYFVKIVGHRKIYNLYFNVNECHASNITKLDKNDSILFCSPHKTDNSDLQRGSEGVVSAILEE